MLQEAARVDQTSLLSVGVGSGSPNAGHFLCTRSAVIHGVLIEKIFVAWKVPMAVDEHR